MRTFISLWSAIILLLGLGTGCAAHKTVTTESTHYSSAAEPQTEGSSDYTVRETETTSRTEVQRSDESGGLLSGTVNVIGETLALPFRFVGGLIRAVF